jgi:sulfur transfer protein SufE
VLDDFGMVSDRNERVEMLIEIADRFTSVPERIATAPYPEDHRVPACESDAYVWSEPSGDNSLKYYFAVGNPQGLSARAMSVILDETLSGQPLEQVAEVGSDIVFTIFGSEVSMGKGAGLSGIVNMVQATAKEHLKK